MSDKEKLIIAVTKYVSNITTTLFGLNLGLIQDKFVKNGIENLISKNKMITDFIFDNEDNIQDKETFFQMFKQILHQHPFVFQNVKFNENDITEIEKIFNEIDT